VSDNPQASVPLADALGTENPDGQDRQVERKLAAILAADVVGYSRLMGLDEEGTLEQLKDHRRILFDPKIIEHRGRIVKTTGDGLLVEFASVVDAVRCAVDVQRGMAERNAETPEERRIEFRIGINVGDIIIDGDDIYGDGVNVAARIESLADPGGIYVSRVVRDQVRDKLDFGFEDMGSKSVKNIARPVRVHRIQLSAQRGAGQPPPIAVQRAIAAQSAGAVRRALRKVVRGSWRAVKAVVFIVVAMIIAYRWVMPPVTPYMLLRLPEAGKIEQRTVAFDAMSVDLSRALIATYDHRFCLHKGVEWDANPEPGGPEIAYLKTANSLTMRLAGSLFLWPGDGAVKRGLEVGLAYAIDLVWPKRRILEVYLNITEWGSGIYGAEAAADTFLHKSAQRLSRNDAALMVAALDDPTQNALGRPTKNLTDRAAYIIRKIDQRTGSYACLP
jgi:class 3 adenylate cyclase